MTKKADDHPLPGAVRISDRINELSDWRGKTLQRVRTLITRADPDVIEEWKWAKATSPGVPVWSHDGIICTGESYKSVVKLTFARGASLEDPDHLFNASLEGNVRRAIDIREGEELDDETFIALIREAVALNSSSKSASSRPGGIKATDAAREVDSAMSAQTMSSRRIASRMAAEPKTQSDWRMSPGRTRQPSGEPEGDSDRPPVAGEADGRRRSELATAATSVTRKIGPTITAGGNGRGAKRLPTRRRPRASRST